MKKLKKINKNLLGVVILVLLIGVTLRVIFKDNDIEDIWTAILSLDPLWLSFAIAAAIFFVCAEGFMIWHLLRSLKVNASLPNCIGYSFVGFFFSGITPSATGGQPMQLYYMTKEKIKISDSTVALTIVATLYKFVLVLIGVFIAVFFNGILNKYLQSYIYLFYFGLALNLIVVIALVFLMVNPNAFKKILHKCEHGLVRIHILRPSLERMRKLTNISREYNSAVTHFIKNVKPIIVTTLVTILQRCSVFFVTYFIYRGMGLNEKDVVLVTVLQASVYIAVDLLPLPGAQGISELMYQTVFSTIFIGALLPASVLVTRGISFYLPLIIGALITAVFYFIKNNKKSDLVEVETETHK
ncbi:MAG: lysylphosphatidylglycerol synthase transmembrane domain-containing protein [Acutalibacteraceae bacterium]|nr:lysylphosphatidylglycerol synthase transmembrane domain-containing protein [Acutalibacteraceae bacterium]